MSNCEEKSCENVQSAICLHCNRRLCTSHTIAHSKSLSKDVDQLSEQINKLAEHLNVCLQQIEMTHNQAKNNMNIWRQREIDKIEKKYTEKIQMITLQQDNLIELGNKLLQRLSKDAQEPLKLMKTENNVNNEVIYTISQTIADIKQKTTKFEMYLTELLNLSSSSGATINTSQEYSENQSYDQNQSNVKKGGSLNSLVNNSYPRYQLNQPIVENIPRLMSTIPMVNPYGQVRYPFMNLPGFSPQIPPQFVFNQVRTSSNPYWSRPAASSIAVYQYRPPTTTTTTTTTAIIVPQSVLSVEKPTLSDELFFDAQRLPTHSSKKLIAIFIDVSSLSDKLLNDFIINDLRHATHVNNMMLLLLSFLEAWYPENSPTIFNERVLSHHISTVKKYIDGRNHELTVIAAIEVFITSCSLDEPRSGQMMLFLLRHFYDHECITKDTILDWYENGASYGYKNFQKSKLWATPFIDKLNKDVQPKET